MMINISKICFLLVIVPLISLGCSNNLQDRKEDTVKSRNEDSLEKVVFKDPPVKFKGNVKESMKYRVEWLFSDGSKKTPKEGDIVWSKVFGEEAVVALRAPVINSGNSLYQILFLEDKKTRWAITTGVEGIYTDKDPISNKYRINLPMKTFSVTISDISTNEKQTWTFVDDTGQVLTIGKYKMDNKEKKLEDSSYTRVKVNSNDAYLSKQGNSSFLYYMEQGYMIWICGNISQSEIKNLAYSLPEAKSFLYKRPVLTPKY